MVFPVPCCLGNQFARSVVVHYSATGLALPPVVRNLDVAYMDVLGKLGEREPVPPERMCFAPEEESLFWSIIFHQYERSYWKYVMGI
jgi:hypothetical protein